MHFAPTETFCLSQSKVKQIMIFEYDIDGIIATDQVPNGIIVTDAFYQKFIRSVLHPQIWILLLKNINRTVSILHSNVCSHVAQPDVNLFIDCAWETLCQPSYSPNSSLLDFDLFHKRTILGNLFWNLDLLTLAITRELCHHREEQLPNGIQKLSDRWQAGVNQGGGLYWMALNFISHNKKYFLNPDYLCITFGTILVYRRRNWVEANLETL